jgi:uncharacterized LabA/DUF88 family protein
MSGTIRETGGENKKTAIYVDGYNLYYGRVWATAVKWLGLPLFFDQMLASQDPSAVIEAVKFFSAPALGRFASHGAASVEAQESYHRALQVRHPARFSMKLGNHSMDNDGSLMPTFVPGQPYDRNLKTRVWRLEEKMTDVNLAMAMYRDASKGLFDQVVLCSNDSDAEPVLEALREDFPALVIGLITPVRPPADEATSRRFSASLAQHAHWVRRYILDDELGAAQLPAIVPTKKKPIRKPTHW